MSRNTLKLDTSGFEAFLRELDKMGGDVKQTVNKALGEASKKITADTEAALAVANLPAGGKYSQGDTERAVIRDNAVRWDGLTGWVPVGFDFSAHGAGGYLITGTPRMRPDAALHKMYKQKKYMRQIQDEMSEVILQSVINAK